MDFNLVLSFICSSVLASDESFASEKAAFNSAYDDASNQQIIDTATPELLVLKLLEKGCVLLSSSLQSLEKSEHEPFQQSSLHALQIVLSLRFV